MNRDEITRPPFQGVELDEMDARLEEKAKEKGIPTLVTPPAEKPLSDAKRASDTPANTSAQRKRVPDNRINSENPPKPSVKSSRKSTAAQATPRKRMRALNIELPDYVWVELKTRAAVEMVSVRHLIMNVLKDSGINITDQDMVEDGRRLRGSRAEEG